MTTFFYFPSPFNNTISTFDNEDSYPDISFIIPGQGKPLRLHRMCLGMASEAIDGVFKRENRSCIEFDSGAQTLTWTERERAESDATYRTVLVKLLRFCYGEDQTFSADECPVALTISSQLGLRKRTRSMENSEPVRTSMEKCIVETVRRSPEKGLGLLNGFIRELRRRDGECEPELNDDTTPMEEDKKISLYTQIPN